MIPHVVIVGGGIAGVAAMERLASREPAVRVTLLEARERLGGHIRTERQDGFLMETGPDVILAAKPEGMDFCRRLGLSRRVIETEPAAAGSLVMRRGRLLPMPDGMSGLVPTRMAPVATTRLLSPLAKLRVACEYVVPVRREESDESVERFVVRRFGRGMYDRLLEPLLTGIVAGDGGRLSMAALFPQLREQERRHGSLLRGMLAGRRAAPGAPHAQGPRGLVSLAGGLSEMVEQFEHAHDRAPARDRLRRIRRGAAVERVERVGERYMVTLAGGETLGADAVIVAVPAFAAAQLLQPLDAGLASALREVEYASTVTISVALPSAAVPALPRGTGYTVPRAEGRAVLACTFTSAKFGGRAPSGHTLFRFFLGGAARGDFVERSDAELTRIVCDELRDVLGVTRMPALVRINRLPRAMPQYAVGHLDLLARMDARIERHGALALAGAAYRGVGIPDCIRSGRRAAERVLNVITVTNPARGRVPG